MKFTTKILGHPWAVEYLTLRQYAKKWGCDSVAITETDTKSLYFIQDLSDLETIRHELAHAYAAQLSLVELQLDDDQVEEFFCEIIGKYSLKIAVQAEEIHEEWVKSKRKDGKKAKAK